MRLSWAVAPAGLRSLLNPDPRLLQLAQFGSFAPATALAGDADAWAHGTAASSEAATADGMAFGLCLNASMDLLSAAVC